MHRKKIDSQTTTGNISSNIPGNHPDRTRFELFAWITPELVEETLQTWQPHYNQELLEADAVEILQNVGRLLDIVQESCP